jgi:DNA-binding NtrC family response regulator
LTRFEAAEVHVILDAIRECDGNRREAAKILGISRTTLYRKLQSAGLNLENTSY